jgi:hypothetical protein
MKKTKTAPVVIDLQRVPTGFKVKDEETFFVLKKTAQHPELNIQRKNPEFHINIPVKAIANSMPTATQPQPSTVPNPVAPTSSQSKVVINPIEVQRTVNRQAEPVQQPQMQRGQKPEATVSTGAHHKPETHDQPNIAKPLEPQTTEGRFKAGLVTLKPVIIPTSAIWFDINNIHRIERESLPEFFCNSQTKTPATYKSLRNKIIGLFYQERDKYLSASFCLKNLVS